MKSMKQRYRQAVLNKIQVEIVPFKNYAVCYNFYLFINKFREDLTVYVKVEEKLHCYYWLEFDNDNLYYLKTKMRVDFEKHCKLISMSKHEAKI